MNEVKKVSELQRAVYAAHFKAAMRDNVSTSVLRTAFCSNGNNINQAVIAAVATLGGLHGPILQAHQLLAMPRKECLEEVEGMLDAGLRVPGWGSSFVKETADPDWSDVDQALEAANFPLFETLRKVSRLMASRDKRLYPNPAAYTACLGICMGLSSSLSPILFLEARAPAWRMYLHKLMNPKLKD